MSSVTPPLRSFAARVLDSHDRSAVLALASRCGVPAAYLHNDVAADPSGRTWAPRCLGFHGETALLAVAYCGARGSLIVVVDARADLDPQRVAGAVAEFDSAWRIALGPLPLLAALAAVDGVRPASLRQQEYWSREPGDPSPTAVDAGVRLAERRDLRWLAAATLELNRVDLGIPPERVSRAWLRDSLSRRLRAGNTWVLGPPGAPVCKLDVGSDGAGGAVVEGVFTRPERRGQGLAARLCASVAEILFRRGSPRICLHVAADNAAAHRAYARAGMRRVAGCGLLLRC